MGKYLWPTYYQFQEKRRGKYCLNLRKRKVKIGSSKKITRVDEKDPSVSQCSQSAETEPCKSEVQEMYLPEHGNWPSISENTG